jgi:hypothetical protein
MRIEQSFFNISFRFSPVVNSLSVPCPKERMWNNSGPTVAAQSHRQEDYTYQPNRANGMSNRGLKAQAAATHYEQVCLFEKRVLS